MPFSRSAALSGQPLDRHCCNNNDRDEVQQFPFPSVRENGKNESLRPNFPYHFSTKRSQKLSVGDAAHFITSTTHKGDNHGGKH